MKSFTAVGALSLALAQLVSASPAGAPFYVYSDKGAPTNHYIPSGWMGDYGDLKLNDGYKVDCFDGKSCIQWIYDATAKQGANWAGAYWQFPANNWGEKPGGFDLSVFKKLTFYAKSDKGGATIATFKVGGITGEHGDSDEADIGPVVLTTSWKKYTIDLSGKNMSHVIGGFCWSASRDDNPNGFTLFLDEIRFEK